MSKEKLKKIVKELEGASKMHAGQAKKLNGMLSKGPFKMKSPMYKRGLWDNIHDKRKRIKEGSGETMRKPGSEGAPSAKNLKDSQ
tara:strand:+ start:206 stop:460 length:255 start_codon:yes stop_codon:yes gene_type:complete